MPFNRDNIFRVHKPGRWRSKTSPSFDEPKIIGYWSLDGNRKLCWDSSQLRYYVPFEKSEVEYDLKEGSAIVERKPDCLDDEKSEHILRWIERNYAKIMDNSDSHKWLQPDFILYRGMLAKIIKAPYNPRHGWIICAAKLNGTIYLCQYDTAEDKRQKERETEETKKKTSWGRKFEQFMLTEAPGRNPDTSKAVNESEQFCCVFQSRLNNHRLLYGAELDGLSSNEKFEDPLPLEKLKFIELKTCHLSPTDKQLNTWKRYRSLGWWAQAHLTGIEEIICGYRDFDQGVVRRLERRTVSDLPESKKEFWNAAICMNFGAEFLNFMKQRVRNDYDETIYKFEKKSFGNIIVTELQPNSEYAFLPDWYIQLSRKNIKIKGTKKRKLSEENITIEGKKMKLSRK